MDRLQSMRVFQEVVDEGGFAAAARKLDLAPAVVTRLVSDLEQHLGVRLLQRTTRHVSTTLDGQAYYERCLRLLADLEEAESFLGGAAAQPKGKLRVDLQPALAAAFLLPHLGAFCARYPGIELEIGMGDRLVDLVKEGVDCVLRGGEPKDSSMVVRRVATLAQVTCASAEYLRLHGKPGKLDEVRQHQGVNFLSSASGRRMPFEFSNGGAVETLQLRGRVAVTNADAYQACCEQGLGLIQVPRYRVRRLLAAKTLVEVLPRHPPPPMPVSILYPHHRQLSPRVRAFVDWVVERLASVE